MKGFKAEKNPSKKDALSKLSILTAELAKTKQELAQVRAFFKLDILYRTTAFLMQSELREAAYIACHDSRLTASEGIKWLEKMMDEITQIEYEDPDYSKKALQVAKKHGLEIEYDSFEQHQERLSQKWESDRNKLNS